MRITATWLVLSPYGQEFFGSFFQERTRFLSVLAHGNRAAPVHDALRPPSLAGPATRPPPGFATPAAPAH